MGDYMLIKRPILTTGILKNNGKEINYTDDFLEKLANQQGDVKIELNAHDGEVIGMSSNLFFEDGKLIAEMDIPDEYIIENADFGFSTDIIPSKFDGNNLLDGYLDSIVFLNDISITGKPNDKNTITRLLNVNEDDNMTEDLSRLYGQLQEENRRLKEEINSLQSNNEKMSKKLEKSAEKYNELNEKYEKGKSLYDDGKKEYEKVLKVAKEFKQMKIDEKNELIDKLVPADEKGVKDEFKVNMYSKLDIDELKSLINDDAPSPSTPPNGASGDGMGVDMGSHEEEPMNYLEVKEAFNL